MLKLLVVNVLQIGFLFVFNLIVGTGALALPKAFQTAGYVLSIAITVISSIIRSVAQGSIRRRS